MRKATVIVICFMIIVFAASLLVLRSYRMDLIHTVVVNAVMQKAPEGYSKARIRWVFDSARRKAEQESRGQTHLEELLSLSQRLEKIQELSHEELEKLLENVDPEAAQIDLQF